ncbi:hypothetical protein FLCU109888_06995 [Flavobacterium cucumis]|uniref:Antitoxin component YwqK of the YwqJK toxin-antitoxin module n=1 Tax=Flavobacterium cucumis TaxID=416016 RepID=A0A1M7ZXN7_9FLAO|nr:hypothetical protein [Flavobacterium cucumis]SHO73628.1 hypothetical protein SAMN05443547_1991 [Flavobacterium cucumis]
MKNILNFLLIIFINQIHSQIDVELYFFNECNNKIEKLNFELTNLDNQKEFISSNFKTSVDTIGNYILSSHLIDGDFRISINTSLKINNSVKFIDTITIPKTRFVTSLELHSKYWNYYNCDILCNGKIIDYFSNGNKRLEGVFKNGKPLEIIYYSDKKGIIELKETYEFGKLNVITNEYFDKEGNLYEYQKIKYRKGKKTIKTFNSKNKLIKTEYENYSVLK